MDIEELSKSQIVLLVLLISFVTSMATGVVTVSLMDQAPASVAQTVTRVLEQTVQEISSPAQSASAGAAVTKTVVVNQGNDIAAAVQKASASVVRLYSQDGSTFLGMGVVLDKNGTLVTDIAAMGNASQASIELPNGSSVMAGVTTRDAGTGLAFLSMATSSSATSTPAWTPIGMPAGAPVLGEVIVLIAGENTTWVGSGLISSLPAANQGAPSLVKTDLSGDNVLYGSPVVDASGNLVGISTEVSRSGAASAFMPVSAIERDISSNASK